MISFRCEYMSRLYSHPREYRKKILANYLCIGFVAEKSMVIRPPNLGLRNVKIASQKLSREFLDGGNSALVIGF